MAFDDALQAIDELIREVADDPSLLADPESVVAIHRCHERLSAVVATSANRFAWNGEWARDGARSPAAWLATQWHTSRSEARRQLRRGEGVSDLPRFSEAWLEGEIASDQVDALLRVKNQRTEDALREGEELLAEQAKSLRHDHFVQALARFALCADPDGAEVSAMELKSRRSCSLAQSFSGAWMGTFQLDPISGTIVAEELARIEQGMFLTDVEEARARLGRTPSPTELRRTSWQRRADALVEMATRSSSCPDSARRPVPLFTILVGYETLKEKVCETERGSTIAPGSLVPYFDEAMFERVVFEPDNRVEVSRTSRFFTGGTRRAIEIRDRERTHPYCDRPAHECQVDHIIPWADGGLTTQENGRVLCGYHNRLRNYRPPPRE